MVVTPSVKALVYCENHYLIDQTLFEKQNEIRKKILEACLDIQEKGPTSYAYGGELGDKICENANITRQEFENNKGILVYGDYIEQQYPLDIWRITTRGRDFVKELRKKRSRLAEFNKLKAQIGVTPQVRGHRLEDLLKEIIEDEGWNAEKRVRQLGMEFDIIFNRDYSYFMTSCKWEKEPIEADDLDQLVMRAQEMNCNAGILVSMSGFTDGCIVRARAKRPIQQVVLFGPEDLERVFLNEKRFTDLLDEKIRELKHKSAMLVDGKAR
jgi:hypothetical protein